MMDVFDIQSFNIIEDEDNYYFFRALNMGDNNDITNNITTVDNQIMRIRTDRERYDGIAKYQPDSKLTLEEIFDHIKMHHRTDTNCISLTSNANVAINYGRAYYKDEYVVIKVPKKELGTKVVNAGKYLLDEINKKISILIQNDELSELEKYFLLRIENAKSQNELDDIVAELKEVNDSQLIDNFERGIIFDFNNTVSKDYPSLNEEQNFLKNKIILKLDMIKKNILSNASNRFLIQTVGNAFSSLEFTHYQDIPSDKIIRVNKKIIDLFSLLQQLPKNFPNTKEIKNEIISNITNQDYINEFEYATNHLNTESDYTIENMYNLTNGNIDYNTSINIYRKSFYLAKSRLRMLDTLRLLKQVTNNNLKYQNIYNYIEKNTYGIEPEIISRLNSNTIKISESVNLDFNSRDMELFNFINSLSYNNLNSIINHPVTTFKYYLDNLKNIEYNNYSKEEYYANAIIDLFDWKKLNVISFSYKQRKQIIDKLIENNVVEVYNKLKQNGIKEDKIANVLLTSIIRGKDLTNVNINEVFTIEELEDFLGYYKIKDTNDFKLRPYQAVALENGNKILEKHQFFVAIMPTGAGKSFFALAKMLENKDAKILYLAPNDIILNQLEDYIIEYIYGTKGTLTRSKKSIIKEIFPNLKLCTYQSLLSENQDQIINDTYDLIFLDELHRSGAPEWYGKIKRMFNHQPKSTKVIGITATPQRTNDDLNMASEWSRYFEYSEKEIERHEHLAINLDLEEAIKLGYVINPKIVFCEYNLMSPGGALYNLQDRIDLIKNEEIKNKSLEKFQKLRRIVSEAKGISQIIGDNVKLGDRCLVFLPVVNEYGRVVEDEDGNNIDSRIYGDDVIEKYKGLLIEYLKDYYKLSEEEINNMVEFHSMLGKYGKGKNQYELEKFEQKNPNKIKFMLVMNKGNEGMHIGCEREINFRPTDSTILTLQQLGRVEYGILPNQIIPDSERPTVIDLVGNLFVYALNKDKNKVDDLDKLKVVIDWINSNGGIIPSLESKDKVELGHAKTLRSIKNKYIKYLNSDAQDKITVTTSEILRIGSMIDLWYIEYPEVINTKDGSKDNVNEEDDTIFELTGILQDLYELSKEVDNYLYMSPEEKKNELIKSIHELHRLPTQRSNNNGKSERMFKDGTDQRAFYDNLQTGAKNIQQKLEKGIIITEKEQQKLKDYEEINRVLSNYVIKVTDEEKKNELIKTIHELHRLPVQRSNNNGESERVFKDGTDHRYYYDYLKTIVKKIYQKLEIGINITGEEQQKLRDYEEINLVLSEYVIKVIEEEKKNELIKTIHELHRLPKFKSTNNGESERVFKDGTDQRNYYDSLKQDVKKIQLKLESGLTLTEEEQQKQKDYEEINKVLSEYVIEVTDEEKKNELIKSIHELHRLPVQKSNNKGKSERVFKDGTDQRNYYNTLQSDVKSIQSKLAKGIILTEEEQKKIEYYEEINEVLNEYIIEVTDEEKKNELKKTIQELHRLPVKRIHNNGESERVFKDGTDQRAFYDNLKTYVKTLKTRLAKGIILTKEKQKKIEYYEEINEVLSEYVIEVTDEEKKNELKKTIQELHRLPVQRGRNNGESERIFEDGTDQRCFYTHLQNNVKNIQKKLEKGINITEEEQKKIEYYEEINEVLSEYVIEVTDEEKKNELKKTIQELHRLPVQRSRNNGESGRIFKDGTDQRCFYTHLQNNVKNIQKKLEKGINITEEEQKKIEYYEEINEVLSEYVIEVTDEEKKNELIKSIHELHRLPVQRSHNNGESERVFKDGTDQRGYYDHLKQDVKKIQQNLSKGITLTEEEQQKIKDYEEINKVLKYYPSRKSDNKKSVIEICSQYNIDTKINKSILDKSYYEVYVKIMYLLDNNIPIVDNEGCVCDIFFMADLNMQVKYNITIDDLVDKYIINGKRL